MISKFLRIHPDRDPSLFSASTTTLTLHSPHQQQRPTFTFSKIFTPQNSQKSIFNYSTLPLIKKCLQGNNGLVFSFGETSSGKSHTIIGGKAWSERGLIPHSLQYLFGSRAKSDSGLLIKFFEIYNKQVIDLLAKSNK